jgi:diacylglycerol kinase (ATP)
MSNSQTESARPRAAVVYNPVKVDEDDLRRPMAIAERVHGWGETLWLETSVDDPGQGPARHAVAEGVDVVLAAGGDGTVRAVAEGVRGTGTPIALLPAGTGNLLARNLDLSLNDITASVETVFTGVDRAIDVGVVDIVDDDGASTSHVFVVMLGVGLDAKMIAATNPKLKKRVGWLAYVEAVARIFKDVDALRVIYSLDGQPTRSTMVSTLLVGNCGILPGNVPILPDAKVDDGYIDIVAMRPKNFFGWIRVGTTVMWENGVLRKTRMGRRLMSADKRVRPLRYFQGRRAELRFREPEEFEIDGEEMGRVMSLSVHVDPAALIVRVPRDADVHAVKPDAEAEEEAKTLEAVQAGRVAASDEPVSLGDDL